MNLLCRLFVLFLFCSVYLEATNTRLGKIAGGHEARPHSNPYVVSLQSRFLWMRFHICTGSILSDQWILSAGHCATDFWTKWLAMDAIVGAHNLKKIRSSMIYSISERIAHPMYGGEIGPYDIAMMKTSRRIIFSVKIQPIKLPISTFTYKNTDDLLITGWGALKTNSLILDLPNELQEVEVTFLPYKECYEAVDLIKDSNELNPLKTIHHICTGPLTGGIAGCTGDSGGPLVQYVPIKTTQTEPTETTSDKEETITSIASTTSNSTDSPIPMSTGESTTTVSTSAPGSTASAIPMTSNKPSTTIASTTATSTAASVTSASTPASAEPAITTEAATSGLRILYNRSSDGKDNGSRRNINDLRALKDDVIPTVVGVLSWGGVPCGVEGTPTVYSNVTNYIDFINQYLHSN